MNAPSRSDFLPLPLSRDPVSQDQSDDRMDQIRELLFGELQKQNDARFVELTLRLREVETVFSRRLDAMQARFARHAPVLATNAAYAALADAGIEPNRIDAFW